MKQDDMNNCCKNTTTKSCVKATVCGAKATLEYDLSKPEQAFAYQCACKGLEACLLLESLKASTQAYRDHKNLPEAFIADMIKDLDQWKDVRI